MNAKDTAGAHRRTGQDSHRQHGHPPTVLNGRVTGGYVVKQLVADGFQVLVYTSDDAVCARRLKEAMDMIDSLSLKQVPSRLMAYFESRQKDGLVDLDLSYRELSKIIGITPEAMSRTLKRMSEDGLIAVDGTAIRILDD